MEGQGTVFQGRWFIRCWCITCPFSFYIPCIGGLHEHNQQATQSSPSSVLSWNIIWFVVDVPFGKSIRSRPGVTFWRVVSKDDIHTGLPFLLRTRLSGIGIQDLTAGGWCYTAIEECRGVAVWCIPHRHHGQIKFRCIRSRGIISTIDKMGGADWTIVVLFVSRE